jgi:hypothetical protein
LRWTLTVRAGSEVERSHYDELDAALQAAEARGRELAEVAPREAVDVRYKKFAPVERVTARLELAGPERHLPSVHAGVDVRGDGSTEAYLGRVRRRLVEQRDGECAYAALRRALSD